MANSWEQKSVWEFFIHSFNHTYFPLFHSWFLCAAASSPLDWIGGKRFYSVREQGNKKRKEKRQQWLFACLPFTQQQDRTQHSAHTSGQKRFCVGNPPTLSWISELGVAKVGIFEEVGHGKAQQPARSEALCSHVQSPFLMLLLLYTFTKNQSAYLAVSLQSHVPPSTFPQWHVKFITRFTLSLLNLMSTAIHLCAVWMPTFPRLLFSFWLRKLIHVLLSISFSVPITTNTLFALSTWHPCQCLCSDWFAQAPTPLKPGGDVL